MRRILSLIPTGIIPDAYYNAITRFELVYHLRKHANIRCSDGVEALIERHNKAPLSINEFSNRYCSQL
jgi:thymidylate synthase ThyX